MTNLQRLETKLYLYWSKNKPLKLGGKIYRVGRMSYGDYFIEPGQDNGRETDPFRNGTIWLKDENEVGQAALLQNLNQ